MKHGAIREALLKKGWTQKRGANFLGISNNAFGRLINFQWVPQKPSKKFQEKIMELTEKSFDELFPEEIRNPKFLEQKKTFERFGEIEPALLLEQANMLVLPPSPVEELIQKEKLGLVKKIMSGLPSVESRAIELHLLDGRTFTSISSSEGVEPETIRQRVSKGLRTIRKRVRESEYTG